MEIRSRARRIELFRFDTPAMRAFHMSWLAFFLCFFAWFAIAPLMAVVREDLGLTRSQVGDTIVASVAATIFVRILVGPLCDRFGPRRVYGWLLLLGALPVLGIGLARSYESFLLFRLAIGAIGASFVVTQYHCWAMFAPNVVGTANALTAGWGNLGGGVAQVAMPLLFAATLGLGFEPSAGWRLAMLVPGTLLLLAGFAYLRLTTDTPEGDFLELRRLRLRETEDCTGKSRSTLLAALRDVRAWVLAVAYAACFGVELTFHNVAPLYFVDRFGADLRTAGLLAGIVGLANVFARALGGFLSDRLARRGGLASRVLLLFAVILGEGLALVAFGRAPTLPLAVVALVVFALFVNLSTGATYGVVPFVNRKAVGAVSGLVAAGGNVGAVVAGLLFRAESLPTSEGLFLLGAAVVLASPLVLVVRFSAAERHRHALELAELDAAEAA